MKESEEARRLTTIPGIGAIVASALVAAVGQAELRARARSRRVARPGSPSVHNWRQAELLGISKRGNKYLRRQLIHGARAALPYVAERDTPLGRWAKGLRKSRPSQRCHRRLRPQAGKNRLGGAAARRTVRRHRNASGGIELGRSRSKRPTVNRGLREGNDGMASTVERRSGSLVQKRRDLTPGVL